jgi:hypothetical protein
MQKESKAETTARISVSEKDAGSRDVRASM